jgi:hypothetical protein
LRLLMESVSVRRRGNAAFVRCPGVHPTRRVGVIKTS